MPDEVKASISTANLTHGIIPTAVSRTPQTSIQHVRRAAQAASSYQTLASPVHMQSFSRCTSAFDPSRAIFLANTNVSDVGYCRNNSSSTMPSRLQSCVQTPSQIIQYPPIYTQNALLRSHPGSSFDNSQIQHPSQMIPAQICQPPASSMSPNLIASSSFCSNPGSAFESNQKVLHTMEHSSASLKSNYMQNVSLNIEPGLALQHCEAKSTSHVGSIKKEARSKSGRATPPNLQAQPWQNHPLPVNRNCFQNALVSVPSHEGFPVSGHFPGNTIDEQVQSPQGLVACRLPQPPDGQCLGCGEPAHGQLPCFVWYQKGLTHTSQIRDHIFAFTSAHMAAIPMDTEKAVASNRMCIMCQPPDPNHTGPLKQGCGQPAHLDHVCASWIAAGVMTHKDVKQILFKKRKQIHTSIKSSVTTRIDQKQEENERCIVPQPPDGTVFGCAAVAPHRGSVCASWERLTVSTFDGIRSYLLQWYEDHPDPTIKLCHFTQPPDGRLRGCGSPHDKGRLCASWVELGVATRQKAAHVVRACHAKRTGLERMCNTRQPPDGRVLGCGERFHRSAVCNSWQAFGVPNREGVKAFVDKYINKHGLKPSRTRICKAPQPPTGRIKGCGLGFHHGTCTSWQNLGVLDRESMVDYIQSNKQKEFLNDDESRKMSFVGPCRASDFPEYTKDSHPSVRYFLEGDLDRAIQELTASIQRDPDNALLYNNRGVAYSERGWPDLAIRDYSTAIELDPTLSDAFVNRGLSRITVDKPKLASQDCKHALSSLNDSNNEFACLPYGMALYESGDFLSCIKECERILATNPSSYRAKTLLGLANGALRQYTASAKYFQNVLDSSPDKEQVSVLLNISRKRQIETMSISSSTGSEMQGEQQADEKALIWEGAESDQMSLSESSNTIHDSDLDSNEDPNTNTADFEETITDEQTDDDS